MLRVDHVPLQAAVCVSWQSCHIFFAVDPLCLGEKLSCAQQVFVCKQIVRWILTKWLCICRNSVFGSVVDRLTTICGSLRHVRTRSASGTLSPDAPLMQSGARCPAAQMQPSWYAALKLHVRQSWEMHLEGCLIQCDEVVCEGPQQCSQQLCAWKEAFSRAEFERSSCIHG